MASTYDSMVTALHTYLTDRFLGCSSEVMDINVSVHPIPFSDVTNIQVDCFRKGWSISMKFALTDNELRKYRVSPGAFFGHIVDGLDFLVAGPQDNMIPVGAQCQPPATLAENPCTPAANGLDPKNP